MKSNMYGQAVSKTKGTALMQHMMAGRALMNFAYKFPAIRQSLRHIWEALQSTYVLMCLCSSVFKISRIIEDPTKAITRRWSLSDIPNSQFGRYPCDKLLYLTYVINVDWRVAIDSFEAIWLVLYYVVRTAVKRLAKQNTALEELNWR